MKLSFLDLPPTYVEVLIVIAKSNKKEYGNMPVQFNAQNIQIFLNLWLPFLRL